MQDFNTEVLLNENKTDGLKFGTYIRKAKKINFQDENDLKQILRLCEIKLPQIDENGWTEITQFIKDRHEIIHNPNNQSIIYTYSEDKIKHIIKNMSNIISIVDETLFTNYEKSSLSEDFGGRRT